MKQAVIAAIVALSLTGCSPGGADAAHSPATSAPASPAVHPKSGLRIIPLTVTHGRAVHRFNVELAQSDREQARGLMFRRTMGANEGMLFPMQPPRHAAFWMRNTVISLDIIFVGTDRRVLNIAANTVPYSEEPLPSDGAVSAVLELVGGRAAQLGIVPGDKVDW